MAKASSAITTGVDKETEKVASCRVAPRAGNPNESAKDKRPRELPGQTIKIKTGCGWLYVTVNRLGDKCHELFSRAGKAGGCSASQCEAIGRLISLAWRKGATPEEVIDQLNGLSCQRQNKKDPELAGSCADGVARAIKMASGYLPQGCRRRPGVRELER